ncbi:phosphotransferase [Streptomyces sp. NPDC020965]|uniref:phosphotransferase n=1 Tax=Streptomyces sp. NPDC020965 TaxID=3365105 RepID=UPI0037B2FAD0
MSSFRVRWEDLPSVLRAEIARRTGKVRAVEPVTGGITCPLTLVIHTAREGRLFLKGVRDDDGPGLAALRREEELNATVTGAGPAIRHTFHAGGWRCLAFAHIPGRTADLSPGSPDLPAVTTTIRRMTGLRPPGSVALPTLASTYAGVLAAGEAELLHGGQLLHNDLHPHNIVVSGAGKAYVVDWAMPCLGPAWADPANTAVRLMESGHSPDDALAWLDAFPVWRRADRRAVETLVAVECRQLTASVGKDGAAASNARFQQLLAHPPR